MGLYSGINFVYWGSLPHHRQENDRTFETYGIQYNHSGELGYAVDGDDLKIVEGSYLFLTRPGVRFRYGSDSQQGRLHNFVTFTGERVQEYAAAGLWDLSEKPPLIRIYEPDRFYPVFLDLLRELGKNRSSMQAINLLDRLLFLIQEQRQYSNSGSPSYCCALEALQHRIIQNPLLDWDFEKESKKIGISYAHFRRLFKNTFQVAPNRFLLRCRFNYATQLLLESDDQIQEIARRSGFDDCYFFSKQFKNYCGITPSAFRKNYQRRHLAERNR